MDPGVLVRSSRAIVAALIITAFIPVGSAAGVTNSTCIGTDGVVSVVSQTVYTDADGVTWLDGVAVNESAVTLKDARLPVTVTTPVAPLIYDVPTGPWTFDIDVDGYLMNPGERSTFHVQLPYDALPPADLSIGVGGGWAADSAPFDLEVVSVTPGPQTQALVLDEPVTPPLWEPRVYTVVIKNNNTLPVAGIEIFGSEYQGVDASSAVLLDSLSACIGNEGLLPGESRAYEVRGLAEEDADPATSIFTDVSAEAAEQTFISVKFGTVAPKYGDSVPFTLTLKHADGTPVLGWRTLKLYWDDGEGSGYQALNTETGVATGFVRPLEKVVYKPVFWGDSRYATAIGPEIVVQPQTEVTIPLIGATTVRKGVTVGAVGLIKPDHAAGSHQVKVQCYRYENGNWVLRKTVASTTYANPGPSAKYVAKFSLPYAGRWRVRGYHPADSHTRSDVSGYDYVTVK